MQIFMNDAKQTPFHITTRAISLDSIAFHAHTWTESLRLLRREHLYRCRL